MKKPEHIAIIMDGNGRWAKERGLNRIKGHERGAESVREIIYACRDEGIKYLTLYAFSVENWVRPRMEINALMRLLEKFLKKNEREFHENKLRLRVIGELEALPSSTQKEVKRIAKVTENYSDFHLILALSYGGRQEIIRAARELAKDVEQCRLTLSGINEEELSKRLYLPDVPDPDLIIRTSGEIRLSNFLLWQSSYSELYFTRTKWPDFRKADFKKALEEYANRQRRFGDIK